MRRVKQSANAVSANAVSDLLSYIVYRYIQIYINIYIYLFIYLFTHSDFLLYVDNFLLHSADALTVCDCIAHVCFHCA